MQDLNLFEKEVKVIIEKNEGRLVLICDDDGKYSVVNKDNHSLILIDDLNVANLLVEKLKNNNTEILTSLADLVKKYPFNAPPPKFWPQNKQWPPKKSKK